MCDSLLAESAMNQTTDTRSEFLIPGTSYSDTYLLSPKVGNSSTELQDFKRRPGRHQPCLQRNNANLFRFQLEEDVQKLQKHLLQEMELHSLLEIALEKNTLKLSSPSHIPHYVQELLHSIAFLEAAISKLERQMVSLHFQLSQERNERRLAEYRLRCSSCQSISLGFSDITTKMISGSLRSSEQLNHEVYYLDGNVSSEVLNDPSSKCAHVCEESAIENTANSLFNKGEELTAVDNESCQHMESWKLPGRVPIKGLWDQPNQLSEEMVRCMKNIFLSLAESAITTKSSLLESHHSQPPRGHHPNSLSWPLSQRSTLLSWVQSPQVDQSSSEVLASGCTYDPYFVRGKLSWADIGSYGLATEVSWMSVGEKQLEYAAGALRRFRTLVEQLAKVNPIHLSSNEKLAFWINLYNALIMHAYLAYGVPRSDLKLFSLMQKAAYTVGGHSFNAAAIEYVILRMKPPVHRPQLALLLALQKMKVTEEQKKFAMDSYEPLAGFALSCGMYSSPAVKIYTAKNVRQELQDAQHDFIRASVGVSSKGKLLLPKMLHCLVKGTVDDANLAVWISHYLPPHQAAFVEHCISHRRQRFLGSRNCGILPFDSRFRYLFLPDRLSTLDVPVLDDLNNHAEPQLIMDQRCNVHVKLNNK